MIKQPAFLHVYGPTRTTSPTGVLELTERHELEVAVPPIGDRRAYSLWVTYDPGTGSLEVATSDGQGASAPDRAGCRFEGRDQERILTAPTSGPAPTGRYDPDGLLDGPAGAGEEVEAFRG